MREIKFRVWDKGNKEDKRLPGMLKVNSIFFGKDIRCICESQERIGIGTILECAESIIALSNPPLMQFTGLKDKNGKEIYEGDIVKYNVWTNSHKNKEEKVIIVDYCLRHAGWKPMIYDTRVEDDEYYNYEIEDIEVIGNMFDNPELLK